MQRVRGEGILKEKRERRDAQLYEQEVVLHILTCTASVMYTSYILIALRRLDKILLLHNYHMT